MIFNDNIRNTILRRWYDKKNIILLSRPSQFMYSNLQELIFNSFSSPLGLVGTLLQLKFMMNLLSYTTDLGRD